MTRPPYHTIDHTIGTAGIAMAMVAAMTGYHMTLSMPSDLRAERRASRTAHGTGLMLTPASVGGMEYARDLA